MSMMRSDGCTGKGDDQVKQIRLTESEGHERASAFLSDLIGATPVHLFWDQDHHSQGHAHVGERELVVIAPRDKVHEVFVLTAEDWDEVRHAPGQSVGELVRKRAIRDLVGDAWLVTAR